MLAEPLESCRASACVEIRVPARVLDEEWNPARRLARHLGDFRGANGVELLAIGLALAAEGVEICERSDPEPTPASVIDIARSGA